MIEYRRTTIDHIEVVAGLIWDQYRFPGAKLLIAERNEEDEHGGLWEFPGGKRKDGEGLEACLVREIEEELAIDVEVQEPFLVVHHDYTQFRIILYTFHCRHTGGTPKALAAKEVRWVLPSELAAYPFPTADRMLINALLQDE